MHRSPLIRLGLAALAAALCTTGLTAPAQANVDVGTLQGTLVDQSGAPVPSVEVHADDGGGPLSATPNTVTDAAGRWKLDVAPHGYAVYIETNGGRQFVPGLRSEYYATRFTVAAGQTVTVDETLLPTGTVTGRLVNDKGAAVSNAVVTLWELNGGDYDEVGHVPTDSDGRYSVGRVFPGPHKVEFKAPNTAVQWAYGKFSLDEATPIEVVANQVATVNDKLVLRGTVAGRFTTKSGKGIAKANVFLLSAPDDEGVISQTKVTTNAKGRFTVTDVVPGVYKVRFIDRTGRSQYAYGKGTAAAAKEFTVKPAKTTTVNDKQVAPATLRVTTVDAKTGKAIRGFCARLTAQLNRCTKTSVLVIKNLHADTFTVDVNPPSSSFYLPRLDLRVKTAVGKTTRLTAKLQLGGKIDAKVVDRATGRAVKRACVAVMVPGRGGLPQGNEACTGAQGRLRTQAKAPGTYNLFIVPEGAYGTQWLGASGGTGDQRAAAKIIVKARKVVKAPKAKLDQAGTISGRVTTADGKPVTSGQASISIWPAEEGIGSLDEQGRYSVDDLGPYQWPLAFATDHGRQWSGGKGNRYAATPVQVVAGQTVSHDEILREPSQLTGTVRARVGTIKDGLLTAYSESTGDESGIAWVAADGTFTMFIPGGERVKVRYEGGNEAGWLAGWYDRAKTFEKATVVELPASGTKALNLTVG